MNWFVTIVSQVVVMIAIAAMGLIALILVSAGSPTGLLAFGFFALCISALSQISDKFDDRFILFPRWGGFLTTVWPAAVGFAIMAWEIAARLGVVGAITGGS
jgi:hypothetical protein